MLYFLKASKRISFLIEMLVSIVRDMGPFLVVMSIIIIGVTVSMIVITGSSAEHYTKETNSDFFDVLFKVFVSLCLSPSLPLFLFPAPAPPAAPVPQPPPNCLVSSLPSPLVLVIIEQ